jgi:hypothetical protein
MQAEFGSAIQLHIKENKLVKKIIFPVTNAVAREKLRDLIINSISEYMDADVIVKTIAVLEVTYPDDRQDLDALFSAIFNSVTRKK